MKVFITSTIDDSMVARAIVDGLREKNVDVFWNASIRPGDNILSRVQQAIDSSDVLLLLLSKTAVKSPWIQTEINLALAAKALDERKRILPVVLEPHVDLGPFLNLYTYADLSNAATFTEDVERLLDVIATPDAPSRFETAYYSERAAMRSALDAEAALLHTERTRHAARTVASERRFAYIWAATSALTAFLASLFTLFAAPLALGNIDLLSIWHWFRGLLPLGALLLLAALCLGLFLSLIIMLLQPPSKLLAYLLQRHSKDVSK